MKFDNLHKTSSLNSDSNLSSTISSNCVYKSVIYNCEKLVSSISGLFNNIGNVAYATNKTKIKVNRKNKCQSKLSSNITLHSAKEIIDYLDCKDCNIYNFIYVNNNFYKKYKKALKDLKDLKNSNNKNNNSNINNVINLNKFQEHSFISIVNSNGVVEEMIINNEEYLILKLAIEHNRGIINLLSRKDSIKSLIAKKLIIISNEDGLLGVNPIVNVIINTKNAAGCVILEDKLICDKDSNIGVVSISWRKL